jgi:hypothetical protein
VTAITFTRFGQTKRGEIVGAAGPQLVVEVRAGQGELLGGERTLVAESEVADEDRQTYRSELRRLNPLMARPPDGYET